MGRLQQRKDSEEEKSAPPQFCKITSREESYRRGEEDLETRDENAANAESRACAFIVSKMAGFVLLLLLFVVELARLFALQAAVLLFSCVVDQVGDDEGGQHRENTASDSPEGVGHALGDGPGKGALLHGGQVVLGGPADLNP